VKVQNVHVFLTILFLDFQQTVEGKLHYLVVPATFRFALGFHEEIILYKKGFSRVIMREIFVVSFLIWNNLIDLLGLET